MEFIKTQYNIPSYTVYLFFLPESPPPGLVHNRPRGSFCLCGSSKKQHELAFAGVPPITSAVVCCVGARCLGKTPTTQKLVSVLHFPFFLAEYSEELGQEIELTIFSFSSSKHATGCRRQVMVCLD